MILKYRFCSRKMEGVQSHGRDVTLGGSSSCTAYSHFYVTKVPVLLPLLT